MPGPLAESRFAELQPLTVALFCFWSQGAGAPAATLTSGITVSVDTAYMNSLGDASAMADGSLSGAELSADPDAAALVAALQAQIAGQMGIDPSMVTITVSHNLGPIHSKPNQ